MALEPKHIVRFFSRMLHLYGHKWSSVYGSALDPGGALSPSGRQWQYDLRDYSPEQVAAGIQRVIERRLEWPPGPIEFANLCDGVPTLAEVLDRDNDHGRLCAEIRKRLDWYVLDSLPSSKRPEAVRFGVERALTAIKRDGTLHALQQQMREALSAQPMEALA